MTGSGFFIGLEHREALGRQAQGVSRGNGSAHGKDGDIGSVQGADFLPVAGVHGDEKAPPLVGEQTAPGSVDFKGSVVLQLRLGVAQGNEPLHVGEHGVFVKLLGLNGVQGIFLHRKVQAVPVSLGDAQVLSRVPLHGGSCVIS